MAKGGNTWCKKLMAKSKRHNLGKKLGTFQRLSLASTLDQEIKAKPREFIAPVKAGYVPMRASGVRKGCRLKASVREKLYGAARAEARDALVAALRQPRV